MSTPVFVTINFVQIKLFVTYLVIILVALIFSSFSFYQGFDKKGNLVIYSNQTHDALWHIALEESLKSSMLPENPVYAGQPLKGYHYSTDLLWNFLSFVTNTSSIDFYLKIAPVLLAFLLSITTYKLFVAASKDQFIAILGTILAILGSGFAYLVGGGQSVFWLDQPINWLANQQLTFSIIVVNIILLMVLSSFKKWWILIGILTGLLTGIKIYSLIIVFPSLGLLAVYQTWKEKNIKYLGSLIIAGLIAVITILFIGSNSSFPFIFEPGWFIKTMYEGSNRLNDSTWELKRQVFLEHNNLPRLIILWGQGLLVFLVGNLGLKILGIVGFFKVKSNYFALLLINIVLFSILIPLVFLQKGIAWNSIQFMHYCQIPLTLLLILGLQKIIKSNLLKITILLLIIIISLPTTYTAFKSTLNMDRYDVINAEQINFYKQLTSLPNNAEIILSNSINGTSVASAVSGRSIYFADETQAEILLIDYKSRWERINLLELGKIPCSNNQYFITLTEIISCQDSKFKSSNQKK